jgi:hypothetical protein
MLRNAGKSPALVASSRRCCSAWSKFTNYSNGRGQSVLNTFPVNAASEESTLTLHLTSMFSVLLLRGAAITANGDSSPNAASSEGIGMFEWHKLREWVGGHIRNPQALSERMQVATNSVTALHMLCTPPMAICQRFSQSHVYPASPTSIWHSEITDSAPQSQKFRPHFATMKRKAATGSTDAAPSEERASGSRQAPLCTAIPRLPPLGQHKRHFLDANAGSR